MVFGKWAIGRVRIMWILIAAFVGVSAAQDMTMTGPYGRMMGNMNDRTLYIRSLPGYPGTRSDLYEVYMEPYYFALGLKGVVELKALSEEGMPMDGPKGVLTLEQMPNGVRIMGNIMGLSPGKHGFHVHDKGDLRKGCASAGPHFNPYMTMHGSPLDPLRHVGDLGNIEANAEGVAEIDTMHGSPLDPLRHVGDLGNIEANAEGVAEIDVMDHYLTLTGVRGAIGRALVVHEKPDDLGRGGTEDSMKTGSAGARLACGVIGFM